MLSGPPLHPPTLRDPLESPSHLQQLPYDEGERSKSQTKGKPLEPRSYLFAGYSRPHTAAARAQEVKRPKTASGPSRAASPRRGHVENGWESDGGTEAGTVDHQIEVLSAVDCARVGLGLPLFQRHELVGTDGPGNEHHHTHEKLEGASYDAAAYGKGEYIIEVDAAKLFRLTERLLSAKTPTGSGVRDIIWEEKQHELELYEGWDREASNGEEATDRKPTTIQFKEGPSSLDDEGHHVQFMQCLDRCVVRGRSAASTRATSAARPTRPTTAASHSTSARITQSAQAKRTSADFKAERAARLASLATPKHRPATAPKLNAADTATKRTNAPPASAPPALKRTTSSAAVPSSRRPSMMTLATRRASSASSLGPSRRASLAPQPPTTPQTTKPTRRPATAPPRRHHPAPPRRTRDEATFVLQYLKTNPPFNTTLSNQAASLEHYQQHAAAHPQVWNPKAFSVGRFILDYTRMSSKLFDPSRLRRTIPNLTIDQQQSPPQPPLQPAEPTKPPELKLARSDTLTNPAPRLRTRNATTLLGFTSSALNGVPSCLDPADRMIALSILRKPQFERTPDDLRVLFRAMRKVGAFGKLSDFILGQLCGVLSVWVYEKDRAVFRQGDVGTAWYIILSGSAVVQVSRTNRIEDSVPVARLEPGQGFGDLALINDSPRLATIITADPCELAVVEKADYNRIIKFIHEKEAKEKMLFLRKIPIFQDWTVASLRSVGQKMEWKKFLPGQVIIAEGQPLEEFFLIKSGTCTIHKTLKRTPTTINPNSSSEEDDPFTPQYHRQPPKHKKHSHFTTTTTPPKPRTQSQSRTLHRTPPPPPQSIEVYLGTLDPLMYFGEDGISSYTPDTGFPLATVTIRAGGPAPSSPSSSQQQTLTPTELLVSKTFDAREKFGSLLTPHLYVPAPTDKEVEKLWEEECKKRRWERVRRKTVLGLVREWKGDPNVGVVGGRGVKVEVEGEREGWRV
ncbi:Cyclic nucleotide-binding domain-containing protein 2 [Rhizophlyctis rosea]|nr:Cyclic nucleotide-binding domain-containing protein 2 [Rhizophlyctis rosea]